MTGDTTVAPARLAGISGRAADGQPLAFHRPPASDLSPWIARMFVTAVEQPGDHTVECGLFNDCAFVRLIVRGDWEAQTAAGPFRRSSGALLFGPHSQRMPVRVTGPFATFGFALRPGALTALRHPWGHAGLNRVIDVEPAGEWSAWSLPLAFEGRTPEDWLQWLESHLRALIANSAAPPPKRLTGALEEAALADPAEPIQALAERLGANMRTMARTAARDFLLSPKQVMRRARVLDMASQLLGFADKAEADEHASRFYDQSHQIRDFRALMGMTPRELASMPRPILTLGLETRQGMRLERLGRLEAGIGGPWRAPGPA